jgi:hypothetical protein
MNGTELITTERVEQFSKHGRTVVDDVEYNSARQLLKGAIALLKDDFDEFPKGWRLSTCNKMLNKSYRERLIIAGALIAAEIDRIQYDATSGTEV